MKFHILFIFLISSTSLLTMKQDPHQIFLNRYPKLYATYQEYSNEKKLLSQQITIIAKELNSHHPDFFKDGIQLFTIGCRDGQTSQNAIEIFSTYCPKGEKHVSFRGIDQFKPLTDQAKLIIDIKQKTVLEGSFETYQLTKQDKKYANVILVLQACHFIKNINLFIQKIHEIAQQDAIIIFAHSDDSQMNWAIKKLVNKFRSPHVTKDICPQIEKYLTAWKAKFGKIVTTPTLLQIPDILPEIPKLEKIQYEDYDNQYENKPESFHIIKNLIELGLDRPLESFGDWTKNWLLLPALKKNFSSGLPLTTHFAVPDNASDKLKKILEKMIKNKEEK